MQGSRDLAPESDFGLFLPTRILWMILPSWLNHLNELNTNFQGNRPLISDLYDHIGGLHVKVKVWEDLFEEAFVDEDFVPTPTPATKV
mgnify:FL=1